MSEKEIARIDAAMNNLASLMREQNKTLNKVLITLTKTQTIQVANSKRIDKLESDRTWLVRLIFGSVIAIAQFFVVIEPKKSKMHFQVAIPKFAFLIANITQCQAKRLMRHHILMMKMTVSVLVILQASSLVLVHQWVLPFVGAVIGIEIMSSKIIALMT